MKNKTTFFLLFFAFPFLSFAQYQQVLSADITKYAIVIEPFDWVAPGDMQIEGDTFFNQQQYKKVYLQAGISSMPSLVGFAREDEEEGKLWFHNILSDQENLVMDLTLEVGDTFNTYHEVGCGWSISGGPEATVIAVSVVGNRKTITLDRTFGAGNICDTLQFIEGVGPNATLFFQDTDINSDPSGFGYKVCQMYQEDSLVYPMSADIDLCDFSNPIAVKELSEVVVKVYPNPISAGKLYFELTEGIDGNVLLLDMLGREVFSQPIERWAILVELDLPKFLKPGIYFYVLQEDEGAGVVSGKVVIE
ncbi:MAG: hypothetical protein ACI8XB_002628 [Patiriisocius sp.]|jgi:hypothetical protein